jgi:hypothetical protein
VAQLLGFKSRFREAVLAGDKSTTIRAPRKRPIAIGDELRMYTGLRTKAAALFATAECAQVDRVRFDEAGRLALWLEDDWQLLGDVARRDFARTDGFATYAEMRDWFRYEHGFPFEGVLVRWRNLKPA